MSSDSLLKVTKKIIRTAVTIGIDEAGTRIMGSAWPYFKKVIAPVIEELERRYPKIFLTEKAAEDAIKDLSTDEQLHKLLNDALANLQEGQEQILAVLASQDETLEALSTSIDEGFKQARERDESAQNQMNLILQEIKKLKLELEEAGKPGRQDGDSEYAGLSISEIYIQGNGYQQDARKWIVANDAQTASDRLAQGRVILEAGLQREPDNANLLVSLGYIEKTQAQVSLLQGDPDTAATFLATAARYFSKALEYAPSDVSSLNGMVNIYLFTRDYDRAIELGQLVIELNPNYGSALWDLSIALEGKLRETIMTDPAQTPVVAKQLKSVYRRLEILMPQQPQAFSATYLARVQERLKALEAFPENGGDTKAPESAQKWWQFWK